MREYATCSEAREEFSALLDGELSAEDQTALENHLADCGDCLRELDGLKKVSDTYESLPDIDIPDDLPDAIRQEMLSPNIDLSDTPREAEPVSFKPVAVALIVLILMAILSFLITQSASRNEPPEVPVIIEEAE